MCPDMKKLTIIERSFFSYDGKSLHIFTGMVIG